MDETKIEQVEAQVDEVTVANAEEVEAPTEEVKAEVEAPAEEANAEEVAPVAESCDCGKCDSCKAKKEEEDDQSEKKVAVKEGLQAQHDAKQRKEVAKEQSKDLFEALEEIAADKVADIVIEAISELPIVEGMSEDEAKAREEEIMENGKILLADVLDVLEEMVNGSTVELDGHQVEVKDFVGTGGKVGMGLPAGINPPCKSEDDESEKKVTIKAYHEGAEEIDYKSKYAESEALMDDLVDMVEQTSAKYTRLSEEYELVVKKLQAYQLSEAYGITVDEANDMLADYDIDEVCEALENAESELAGEPIVEEAEEEKAEDKEGEEPKAEEEKKEEKEEKAKEKEQEKAMEEIKESAESVDVAGEVISEAVEEPHKIRAFSVFASNPISESKKTSRKAFSVFND